MLADWEVGQCLVSHVDGRVRVDRADPIIHISVELLEASDHYAVAVDGDLVTLGDINPVTYRIAERDARIVEACLVTSDGA